MSASQPTLMRVEGERADHIAHTLLQLVRAARLNSTYPDARAMLSHLGALTREVHQGLYDALELHLEGGLPSYREWTRVQTDATLAADQLRQLGARDALARRASGSSDPIHTRQLQKFDYYSQLVERPLSQLGGMQVALRRVEPEQRTAWFQVTLDKLDASGVYIRYSIDLSQRSGLWTRHMVTLDAEQARHTEGFQALIYKLSGLDASFTFARLAALDGLTIERVSRGVVGPIFWSRQMAPAALHSLWDAQPDAVIATFSHDVVEATRTQPHDNDPLFDALMTPARAQARAVLGELVQAQLHPVRDRKFVTQRALVTPLKALCERLGTRNLIYGC